MVGITSEGDRESEWGRRERLGGGLRLLSSSLSYLLHSRSINPIKRFCNILTSITAGCWHKLACQGSFFKDCCKTQ